MMLPSTRSLEAFIGVARRGSLTAAAIDLNMSVPALSRRIRLLEEDLGTILFVRLARGVALTPQGARYFDEVGAMVDRLRGATAAIRRSGRDRVRISTIPALAVRWLLPRLPRFAQAHPDIEVDVQTSTAIIDLDADDVDLAIRLGDSGSLPDRAEPFLPIDLMPVWSPGHVSGLSDPASLADHVLLGPDHRPEFWAEWARGRNIEMDWLRIRQVDSLLLYELAVSGAGVAIGIEPLVTPLLADGRLNGLTAHRSRSSRAFHLVRRSSSSARRSVRLLSAWLAAEAEVGATAVR